jgi:hypothetical protein
MTENIQDKRKKPQQYPAVPAEVPAPKMPPLTPEETNELHRLNLIRARVDYDTMNARHQLNLKRESQGCTRGYIS